MVEFALVLPVLFLVLFGLIQFGMVLKDYHEVTGASRAGARKASVCKACSNAPLLTETAAKNSTSSLDKSKITVTVDPSSQVLWVRGGDVKVTVKYPYSINVMGVVVASGNLTSQSSARVE